MRVCVALIALFLFSSEGGAASFSDLAREEFDKGPAMLSPLPRSPFLPGVRLDEEIDPASLYVEGIVWGKGVRMILVAGMILREGDKIGKYSVKEITMDKVFLSYGETVLPLRIHHAVGPSARMEQYHIEFQKASLRDALRLLSTAAGLNLIAPDNLTGQVTVSLHDVDLMQAIRSILRVNNYEYAVEAGIIRVGQPDDFAGGTDLMTMTFPLKYATAKTLVDTIKPLLSDRGQVIADERTNTVTVKDRDPIVANISSLLERIDRRDRQVRIEARIVDATRDFSRALGIRWGVTGQKGNVTVSGTDSAGTNPDTTNPLNVNLGAESPTSGIGLIIGQLANAIDIEAQLTAAEQNGNVKILSKPSVTTVNNMPAKIRSGTKIYVKSTSTISLGTTGGSASGDTSGLQEIDTGIELTVTPQITVEDTVKLRIEATQSEADFSRTVDGIPAVIDSTAATTVLLADGSTTVIGGLFRVRTSVQKRGVPGFQKIPGIGYLFQSRSKSKTDTELMIFITPRIVGS